MDFPQVWVSEVLLFQGKKFNYGWISVSEEEIIAYALVSDPLPLHIDPVAAAKSRFGKIVASGTQLFSEFHRRYWIPQFGKSVVAGLSIRNWEFLKPQYPDAEIEGALEVLEVIPKPERKLAVIHWKYSFRDRLGELVQTAEFHVMHKTD